MTNRTNLVASSDFIPRDEIDELFGNANANPARIGCPPEEDLPALARRERPIDDAAYDHLADCSPCYRKVRALQQAWERQRGIGWSNRTRWVAAAAALVFLVAGSAWLYVRTNSTPIQPTLPTPSAVASARLVVELDLRRYTVSRSPQEQVDRPPLALPQGLLNLTLLLPVGSEPGAYDLQLMDAASRVMASASGNAAIRNFITTLEVTIDLRATTSGPYQLAFRRSGEDWRVFPATVK